MNLYETILAELLQVPPKNTKEEVVYDLFRLAVRYQPRLNPAEQFYLGLLHTGCFMVTRHFLETTDGRPTPEEVQQFFESMLEVFARSLHENLNLPGEVHVTTIGDAATTH